MQGYVASAASILAPFVACGLVAYGVGACGLGADDSTFDDGSGQSDGNINGGGPFGREDGGGGDGGSSSGGNNGDCSGKVVGLIRDFNDTHPDFESVEGSDQGADPGIVEDLLGADRKPVYKPKGGATTKSTSGKANFDQWYRDTAGTNLSQVLELPLTIGANGVATYENGDFFPIDGVLFGNQGRNHNFHFTFELHTEFTYGGGEVFKFTGDDDVFTFINGHLAIDLGGVHGAESQDVKLDDVATSFALERGKTYTLDVFQAERHTTQSSFRIDTTIKFTNCEPIIIR